MVTTSILGVLWGRVILELVVVRFNMAESLRSLENDLKVARKNEATTSGITKGCTRSRGPRGFFCLQGFRRGPVNVAVITLKQH